ncbi:MAG: hypothetical protein PVH73_08250 [Candidatus Bathyarchaeota archaeon]
MKKNYCKTKIATIALILTLTLSAITVSLPLASWALELPADIPTFLHLSATPNPVGVDQICYVQAIFTKPLPTSQGNNGDRHEDVTVEITAPDGSKTVMGPYTGGMTGGVATSFIPNQIGEYSLQAFYPGQVLTGTNEWNPEPSGWMAELRGSTMLPSESEVVTLTVQSDPIDPIYQTPSLPEHYWTRPIYATNWDWGAQIGSNWYSLEPSGFTTLGRYDAIGGFDPYGKAPNSPHILWTKPTRFGGQPGGPIPSDQSTQFSSTDITIDQYDGSIILAGVLYYTKFAGWGSGHGYMDSWVAVDLRTGETLWEKPAGLSGQEWLRYGQIVRWHNIQGYGSQAFLWSIEATGSGIFGPSGDLVFRLYDAYTGKHVCNITTEEGEADTSAYARNLGMITDIEGDNPGGLIGYYTVGDQLYMWNSSKLFEGSPGRLSVSNQNYTFADGVQWNRSIALELNGQPVTLSLSRVTREVILLRDSPTFIFQGSSYGYQVTAGIDAHTGALLWGPINQTLPQFEDINLVAARDGYYFIYNTDAHETYCYSLTNGQKVWGPIEVPYDVYASQNAWAEIAYGRVYFNGGGGIVNCQNLTTGELEWSWSRGSAGYDTPFGVYPIFGYRTQTVCDGKLFLSEGYLYTPPLHPARRIVLNCTDGSLVWSILSYSSRASGAHADECFVDWNAMDCQIYTYGKGPSETIVSVKNNVLSQGSSVLIEGTVMDISPGTSQTGVKLRFPKGVPAVSEESMREWMEFVYMQQNCPSNAEGVDVFVKVLDPNGDWYSETVTTDTNGVFSLSWAPAIVGDYHVTAIFEGSESYCISYSTTTFTVDEAQAAAGAPSAEEIAETTVNKMPAYSTITEMPAYLTIDLVILIIAIVVLVIALLAYMALRKQK